MIEQKEIDDMKGMVRWFDPGVLFKVIKPVIISGVFGEYADRRLIQAALDKTSTDELFNRADVRSSFVTDDDGSIWFDYTADTGDGFSSTYSIASILARPTLNVGDIQTRRGDLLVLGGDQVYPDATYETYFERFRKPFKWAFPDQKEIPDDKHPMLYAIPGNHDWYDGLDLFLALFCGKKSWSIGNWRAQQRRSYFALQLSDDWWLWGVDIQLSERVDQPQADYFETIASEMPKSSNLIICTAVPGWLYGTSTSDKAYQSLGYFAKIARKANKDIRIPLVLSGDTHHYSRYSATISGTQFITAGGGGAFLHPTHQLKNEISAWWIDKNDCIKLASIQEGVGTDEQPSFDTEAASQHACYPSQEISRKLLTGNLTFAFKNWKFSAILGCSYTIFGLLILMWTDLSSLADVLLNPLWWAISIIHVMIYIRYADDADWVSNGKVLNWICKRKHRKWILGIVHATAHIVALTALSNWLYTTGINELGLMFWTWSFNAYFSVAMTILGGLVAGILFGLYLLLSCRLLGVHANDAFSAMSLDSYKHFLRIRISGKNLTLYPIGLDKVPSPDHWVPNPNYATGNSEPTVISTIELSSRLIEGPIKIS